MARPIIVVKIMPDPDALTPRDADNLGVMVCWHGRHTLGDEQPTIQPDEWLKAVIGKGDDDERTFDEIIAAFDGVVLPLFLLDHSGLRMRAGSFNDPWDSGQVGWIWASRATILKWFGRKRMTKALYLRAEKALEAEVDVYDDYLSGNVWGYDVEVDGESVEACWGFFGDPKGMRSSVSKQYRRAFDRALAAM